ncbi:MAG: tRNA preQ1(34) S-adenosylmethionine ribosyltransferase-isomerase QueA [Patescibacteria group bacterium]
MKTADFDFDLPESFIAQAPVTPRDSCKLLVYDTKNDLILHKKFYEIKELVAPGDTFVLNRSKVVPARILFDVNGKEKEIFVLNKVEAAIYQVLLRPARFFKPGIRYSISEKVDFEVIEINEDGTRILKFFAKVAGLDLDEELKKLGQIPLPPYIKNDQVKFEEYQTVYAKEEGSKAAPTAGLHFTDELISDLKLRKANFAEVILHVGLGTFLPVSSDNIEDHKMHSEKLVLPKQTCDLLNSTKRAGGRLIAVGTTSVRVLESVYSDGFEPCSRETSIFIYPGSYKWKCVDALITNFHLPKSSLIMLVASFLESKGVKNPGEKIISIYKEAMRNGYRFYSFGDAMFVF